ncbi:MAG: ATP-binding cassette domain-containing protein, partial [Ornithinibacter sp.]
TADPREAQTLADRLGGYANPAASYGDVPLDELAGLRDRILVSINEDRLFTGVFHEEIGEAGIWAACAEDILEAVGSDSTISEGGREFSGGQQQRLRLARALQTDPEVLILVEPTSAVDAHTEARIAERLVAHRAGRTTVLVTASPLLLDRADSVVLVEGGRVTATGRHHDLLRSHPAYREIVLRGGE